MPRIFVHAHTPTRNYSDNYPSSCIPAAVCTQTRNIDHHTHTPTLSVSFTHKHNRTHTHHYTRIRARTHVHTYLSSQLHPFAFSGGSVDTYTNVDIHTHYRHTTHIREHTPSLPHTPTYIPVRTRTHTYPANYPNSPHPAAVWEQAPPQSHPPPPVL